MNENDSDNMPFIWVVDSDRGPLAESREAFAPWANAVYIPWGGSLPEGDRHPDAIVFSAEIHGGAGGDLFANLSESAGGVPLIAVARMRSLAQALAFFRAGIADYLSLPLDGTELENCFRAALERTARLALQGMIATFEPLDNGPEETATDPAPRGDGDAHDDILARLSADEYRTRRASAIENPIPPANSSGRNGDTVASGEKRDDEPAVVDGLPVPSLWEELPCGLLLLDSRGNLVFSNRLGLELLGARSLADLQGALENRRNEFSPRTASHHPLPDNQWPHILAMKSRVPRSAIVSIERPDHRRVWLRMDCMPHLSEGEVARLSMTLVNLTGELPAFAPDEAGAESRAKPRRDKAKPRGKKRR